MTKRRKPPRRRSGLVAFDELAKAELERLGFTLEWLRDLDARGVRYDSPLLALPKEAPDGAEGASD